MRNLTEALASCLSDYATINGSDRLPFPAPMNLGDYRDDSKYDDASGYTGRFPFNVASSNDAIWPVTKPSGIVANLFEIIDPAPPPPPAPPQLCANLELISGPDAGTVIDLYTATSTYRKLWNNWKDHFFYVLSKNFEPAETPVVNCGSNCITVNTVPMAGVVIYAGPRQGIQIRNGAVAAGDINTKGDISNYIDDASNQAAFIAATGKGVYVTGGNDIMYCIKPDLGVESC